MSDSNVIRFPRPYKPHPVDPSADWFETELRAAHARVFGRPVTKFGASDPREGTMPCDGEPAA